ncbi:MAG: glycosyltransferase [Sulfurovum sp.]|nr:glycosyltransferase [Sulfurovum sp.]
MKRVLFITTHPVVGGAQKWTYDQINLLSKEYEIYFATGSDGWLVDKVEALCQDIFINKDLYSFSSLSYLFKIYNFVKTSQIDMIVASSANAGIYARLLKILIPSLKIVYVSHGWSAIYRGNWVHRKIEKILSVLTTAILVVSKEDYRKGLEFIGIDSGKLILIENAIAPCVVEEKEDLVLRDKSKEVLSVVMVARFEYPKRQDLLIEAAKKLSNIHIFLVGEGENLQNLQEKAPVNVTFLDAATNVNAALKEADVFALLSDSEGMSLAVMEALSCGIPLILSDIPSMQVFIQENGFLVENDIDVLVKVLEGLQKNDLEELGKSSEKLFNEKFNLEKKKNIYLRFYQNLLG